MRVLFFTFLAILNIEISQAALYVRDLDGDLSNGHEGVYDDVLDITWLADANLPASNSLGIPYSGGCSGINSQSGDYPASMCWNVANSYIAAMNATNGGEGYLGSNEWRLPFMVPYGDSSGQDFNGDSSFGYNFLTYDDLSNSVYSELGYMFYDNFEAVPSLNTDGEFTSDSGIAFAADPNNYLDLFQNLNLACSNCQPRYWTSTPDFDASFTRYWTLGITTGFQAPAATNDTYFVWAVHDGDLGAAIAVVPLPATIWLFLSALAGLLLSKTNRSKSGY